MNISLEHWLLIGPSKLSFHVVHLFFRGIANEAGYCVIPIFCGHGIGEDFHMKPDIIHIGNVGTAVMKAGMIFTIGMEAPSFSSLVSGNNIVLPESAN